VPRWFGLLRGQPSHQHLLRSHNHLNSASMASRVIPWSNAVTSVAVVNVCLSSLELLLRAGFPTLRTNMGWNICTIFIGGLVFLGYWIVDLSLGLGASTTTRGGITAVWSGLNGLRLQKLIISCLTPSSIAEDILRAITGDPNSSIPDLERLTIPLLNQCV
jgi:hypothetical protein